MNKTGPFCSPWHAASYNDDGTHDVVDSKGRLVAEVTAWASGDPINLIIAAPDLLGACKLAEDLITGKLSGVDPENTMVLPALRAAIEKAEGGENG